MVIIDSSSEAMLNEDDQAVLLELARRSVALGLMGEPPLEPMVEYHSPCLRRKRSSFVTLRQNGEIVGRAGTVEPTTALISDVCNNAYAAAYHCRPDLSRDPLMVEVYLVNGLEHLKAKSFGEVCQKISVGEHGALLQHTHGAATLTPDNWEQFRDTAEFTRQLCSRAGICPDTWQDDAQLLIYRVETLPKTEIARYQTWRPDKPR